MVKFTTATAISIVVIIILAASMMPTGFSQWFNSSKTGWTTPAVSIWNVAPILGIAVILVAMVIKYLNERPSE